eukprot:scaffold2299_cov131-Cylindrotheca_fusiformis.AAC.37
MTKSAESTYMYCDDDQSMESHHQQQNSIANSMRSLQVHVGSTVTYCYTLRKYGHGLPNRDRSNKTKKHAWTSTRPVFAAQILAPATTSPTVG